MKRFVFALLIAVAASLAFPFSAFADDALETQAVHESGTCYWTIDSEGTLLIYPQSGNYGTLGFWNSVETSPWHDNLEITKVRLRGIITAQSCIGMFSGCVNIKDVSLTGIKTSGATSMEKMFYGCEEMSTLNISDLDTSSVTNMSYMFGHCHSLKTVDLKGFDLSKVTTMGKMFYSCFSLETMDLSDINLESVTTLSCMFEECTKLTSVDFTNTNLSSLQATNSMFSECRLLDTVDLSAVKTAERATLTNMKSMFDHCVMLTSVNLSGLDTSQVTDVTDMFCHCETLTTVYADTYVSFESVTDSSGMFSYCNFLRGGLGSTLGKGLSFDYACIDQGKDKPGVFTFMPSKHSGNVNGNSQLNVVDAQLAYDIANGKYATARTYAYMCKRADVTGAHGVPDGNVDSQDALRIQYVALRGWE